MGGMHAYMLTGFYEEPDRSHRRNSWDLLRKLECESSLPWCVIDDTNNTLSLDDKRGGRPYPNWLLQGCMKVIANCNLTDIKLEGYPYTWKKGKGADNGVEVRLDWAWI